MSVLRSKRTLSPTEFENHFSQLYEFNMNQMNKVPKRKQKWLCDPINRQMNYIYDRIMRINDIYIKDKAEREKYIVTSAEEIVNLLIDLEKPLMMLWNVQSTETKTMAKWVTFINREIELLDMKSKKNTDRKLFILDWKTINSAQFLKNMSELHIYTHSKVVNACNMYDNTQGSLLIELVNNAFYEIIEANKRIPKTKEQYEKRRQHISNAIMYLNEMNRPMLSYFNLMHYSERIMVDWSEMFVNEIKMLTSLQKSDKSRFKHLL